MARARNIKPGFFRNEILVGLPFEFRLLFIGLWTVADRAGRFEDRPTRIKMELFPVDNVDVDAGLQALHKHGFITRYCIDGTRYCQVLAWDKHQNPHVKEAQSTIPAPDENHVSLVQAPDKHPASPSDSLIPSSLIPDSKPLAQRAERLEAEGTRFEKFWEAYPRRVGKQAAQKAFAKVGPDDELLVLMLAAVKRQTESDQWQRDGGQFVPHPATWLNGRRWEDEIQSSPQRQQQDTNAADAMLRRAV